MKGFSMFLLGVVATLLFVFGLRHADRASFGLRRRAKAEVAGDESVRFAGRGSVVDKEVDSIHSSGPLHVESSIVRGDLHSSGSVTLRDSTVHGDFHSSGAVKASNFQISDVYSSGTVRLLQGKVLGSTSFSGSLHAEGVSFAQDLSSSGKIGLTNSFVAGTIDGSTRGLTLDNSEVYDIFIRGSRSFFGTSAPIIILRGKSIVHGNIAVAENIRNARVIIESGAEVRGEIKNAEVESR